MRLHKNCATNLGITELHSVQLQRGKKAAALRLQALCSQIHVAWLLNLLFSLLFHNENYVSFGALAERSQASPVNSKHAHLCSKAL